MTLQEAKMLHAFNSWATQKMFDAAAALSTEQWGRDMKVSHGSFHATFTHLVSSERIWIARFVGTPPPPSLQPAEVSTVAALKSVWEAAGFDFARWLGGMTDKKLQEEFTVTAPDGKTYRHTFSQTIQHIVDHCTYHRGQLVALLRQFEIVPPQTSLIRFYRETAGPR